MIPRSRALWLVALLVVACGREPALVRQMQKVKLVHATRDRLLESVEAEKSAVLSTTDEESEALAREAQRSATEINRLRATLRELVIGDGRREEIEKLGAFDAAWAELEDVDSRLLALAVANTNLKATRLSARDGAAALDRLVDALAEMQRTASDGDSIRQLSLAAVAALRVQSLLLLHIPSADNEEMTRLERQMRDLGDAIDRVLASLRGTPHASPEQVAKASLAWSEYQRIMAEVLRLSRENTNVLSFDVSVHEKRHVTKECLAALAALLTAVESTPHATR